MSTETLFCTLTCKDRWRQVLSEANRVHTKHLVTLEAAISVRQTSEMQSNNVQLVVPSDIHSTYTQPQTEWLLTIKNLVDRIKKTTR